MNWRMTIQATLHVHTLDLAGTWTTNIPQTRYKNCVTFIVCTELDESEVGGRHLSTDHQDGVRTEMEGWGVGGHLTALRAL